MCAIKHATLHCVLPHLPLILKPRWGSLIDAMWSLSALRTELNSVPRLLEFRQIFHTSFAESALGKLVGCSNEFFMIRTYTNWKEKIMAKSGKIGLICISSDSKQVSLFSGLAAD